MTRTLTSDKKPTNTTAEAQCIEQVAVLVHELRTTGCDVIDILGQAETDSGGGRGELVRETDASTEESELRGAE